MMDESDRIIKELDESINMLIEKRIEELREEQKNDAYIENKMLREKLGNVEIGYNYGLNKENKKLREKVKILELQTENAILKERNKILEERNKILEEKMKEEKKANCDTCGEAAADEFQYYKCICCFFTLKKHNCNKCETIYVFKCSRCLK